MGRGKMVVTGQGKMATGRGAMGRGAPGGSRVRVILPEALRELAGGRAVVEVGLGAAAADGAGDGAGGSVAGGTGGKIGDARHTVGGLLGSLGASYPGLHDRLMTEQGALRPHVNIFVDGENIRFTGGLGTRVGAGSEIFVLPAISGG